MFLTQETTQAYAHCRDARCPGYQQQMVDAVREEQSFTFGDGDRLGAGVLQNTVEKSHVSYTFADPKDAACPACGQPREVTGDPRPQYVNESGHDPLGLLGLEKFDQNAPPRMESDEEIEFRLLTKLREEQIEARLRKEMLG